jgi:type III restriction enzyme
MLAANKSVYEQTVYNFDIERSFADELEKNSAVKVYAKLPVWFKLPTPLGTYNPDWAVLIQQDGQERLYFVVETKGTLFADSLRSSEAAKIKCGEAHFKAIAVGNNPARFKKATKLDDLLADI